jgi:phage shock protein PspC (stress-responsive transcriptional regulator)
MLFGVAGGMADWLDLDPSLVRLVWALLVVAGGVGLLLYIIAAIVVPEEPLGAATAASSMGADAVTSQTAGAAGSADANTDDWSARRQARRAARADQGGNSAMIFGLVLIALGGWFLIDRFINIDKAIVLPGVLIVLGGALVLVALSRSGKR